MDSDIRNDKVLVKKFSVYDKDIKLYSAKFLYIKAEKYSQELTQKFNIERNKHKFLLFNTWII